MIMRRKQVGLLAIAAVVGASGAAPAAAAGCNGVVNPFVWGCAPWDNNNGPNFPYYKKKTVSAPASKVKIEVKNGARMGLYNGQWYPVISAGGGNVKLIGGAGAN